MYQALMPDEWAAVVAYSRGERNSIDRAIVGKLAGNVRHLEVALNECHERSRVRVTDTSHGHLVAPVLPRTIEHRP